MRTEVLNYKKYMSVFYDLGLNFFKKASIIKWRKSLHICAKPCTLTAEL